MSVCQMTVMSGRDLSGMVTGKSLLTGSLTRLTGSRTCRNTATRTYLSGISAITEPASTRTTWSQGRRLTTTRTVKNEVGVTGAAGRNASMVTLGTLRTLTLTPRGSDVVEPVRGSDTPVDDCRNCGAYKWKGERCPQCGGRASLLEPPQKAGVRVEVSVRAFRDSD